MSGLILNYFSVAVVLFLFVIFFVFKEKWKKLLAFFGKALSSSFNRIKGKIGKIKLFNSSFIPEEKGREPTSNDGVLTKGDRESPTELSMESGKRQEELKNLVSKIFKKFNFIEAEYDESGKLDKYNLVLPEYSMTSFFNDSNKSETTINEISTQINSNLPQKDGGGKILDKNNLEEEVVKIIENHLSEDEKILEKISNKVFQKTSTSLEGAGAITDMEQVNKEIAELRKSIEVSENSGLPPGNFVSKEEYSQLKSELEELRGALSRLERQHRKGERKESSSKQGKPSQSARKKEVVFSRPPSGLSEYRYGEKQYSPGPKGSLFYEKSFKPNFTQKLTFYEIWLNPESGHGVFFLVEGYPDTLKIALNYRDTNIINAMDIVGDDQVGDSPKIKNQDYGTLIKEGDAWRIVEKGKVEFR